MRFLISAILALSLSPQGVFSAAPRPNIVIIFMDDMGYADVGCFGAQGYHTPNIDQLAAAGRKFTNSRCPWPECQTRDQCG